MISFEEAYDHVLPIIEGMGYTLKKVPKYVTDGGLRQVSLREPKSGQVSSVPIETLQKNGFKIFWITLYNGGCIDFEYNSPKGKTA